MSICEDFHSGPSRADLTPPPVIETTFWGYILAGHEKPDYFGPTIRWMSMFFGVSLIFAAMGFWLVPVSAIVAEIILFKLASSLTALMLGIMLLHLGQEAGRPEVQVDMSRKELRFLQRGASGIGKLTHVIGFDELGAIDIDGDAFRSLDRNEKEMAGLALSHAFARETRQQLDGPRRRLH